MQNQYDIISSKLNPIVAVVGSGNVACHLSNALHGKADLHLVDPHSFEGMPAFADIVLIAVKDSAIEQVAKQIPGNFKLIAHTSGSVPMAVLDRSEVNFGVFYPLQTFSRDTALNYADIPFFIEGNTPTATLTLASLARLISKNVYEADSERRRAVHLASVFACNFSNCLIETADNILRDNGMDYRILLPLLRQTIAKLDTLTPHQAQTGPASREDHTVMENHISMLNGEGKHDLANIYADLSNLIIKYKNERH